METSLWSVSIYRRPINKSGNVLSLTPNTLWRLGLSPGQKVGLKISNTNIMVRVYAGYKGKGLQQNVLMLDENQRMYNILYGRKLLIRMDDSGQLHLGPIIGIFTYHDEKKVGKGNPFGAQSDTFKQISQIAKLNHALVVIFTPNGVKNEQEMIIGRTITLDGSGWQNGYFPWPEVIYNRIPTRTDESRQDVQHARSLIFSRPGIKFFNPEFLDKWHVYKYLVRDEDTRIFLPETTLYTNFNSVIKYLFKYSVIYLKPTASSVGKGIIQIQLRDSKLTYSYKDSNGKNVKKVLSSINALKQLLPKHIGNRSYLVQQGIILANYKNRPFDVRLLTQKNTLGEWKVTGMAARVAGEGSITTHIPNGGSSKPLLKVLRQAFLVTGVDIQEIENRLVQVAEELPPVLEINSGKLYGELSMDVGVDYRGRVWLIEMNSKPFRFDEKEIRIQSWENIIRYAAVLAGF